MDDHVYDGVWTTLRPMSSSGGLLADNDDEVFTRHHERLDAHLDFKTDQANYLYDNNLNKT